jgi:hypothetical protein
MSNTVEVHSSHGQFTVDRQSGRVVTELPDAHKHITCINPDTLPKKENAVDILSVGYWFSGYEPPTQLPAESPAEGEQNAVVDDDSWTDWL